MASEDDSSTPKLKTADDLRASLAQIQLSIVDGNLLSLESIITTSDFTNSITNGGFRKTFGKGGEWLSSFNNMKNNNSDLRDPAIQDLLRRVADSLTRGLSDTSNS